MALSSFTVKARGLDGIPYRIDVNGGGTVVTANGQFFVVDRGDSEDRGFNPIWPSKARIFMRDVDVSPLFGEPDREVPVEAFDITGSADTLVFSGYMVTDFFGDAPFAPANIVELQALDGLGTLENDPIDDLYTGDSFVSYQTAIVEILRGLAPLGVEIGAHWYPARSSIAASDNPLESGGFTPNNYREDRPEGDYLNQLSLLRDLLKGTGATVQQVDRRAESADARWHVRQRDALNEDGTIKAWVYTAATDSPSSTTLDRSRQLSVNDLLRDHSRDFVRRRQTVKVTHDHSPISNLFRNPIFKQTGGIPEWKTSGFDDIEVTVVDHDTPGDLTQPKTQDNPNVLKIKQTGQSNTTSGTNHLNAASQVLKSFNGIERKAYGELTFSCVTADNQFRSPGVGFRIGSNYLYQIDLNISYDVNKGTGTIPLDTPLQAPIPNEAKLPLTDFGDIKGTVTLKKRAEPGDGELFGDITTDPKNFYTIPHLYFKTDSYSSGDKAVNLEDHTDISQWGGIGLRFSLVNESGNVVSGETEFFLRYYMRSVADKSPAVYFDKANFELRLGGEVIDKSVTQASVPELGETEEQTIRTSSGPTTQNLARMRGNDPNGTGFEPTQWDVKKKVFNGTPEVDSDTAAGSTSVPVSTGYRENLDLKAGQGVGFEGQEERYLLDSGLAIGEFSTGTLDLKRGLETALSAGDEVQLGSVSSAELKAQQRLRYWQNHNEKLTVTAYQRDGGLPLTGDELVTLDGTGYTVHSVKYDAAAGESRATLIEWNDYQ